MNKNAIKKFAIEARKKLIDSVTDKAGMLGITEKLCSEPITNGADFEVYQTIAGTEVTLNKRQCEQRRRPVSYTHLDVYKRQDRSKKRMWMGVFVSGCQY